METVALFIVTNLLGQALKATVFKKYGVVGVQVAVFTVALIAAAVWYAALQSEPLMAALLHGVQVFTYAIAFYEVVLKNIKVGGYKVRTTKDV